MSNCIIILIHSKLPNMFVWCVRRHPCLRSPIASRVQSRWGNLWWSFWSISLPWCGLWSVGVALSEPAVVFESMKVQALNQKRSYDYAGHRKSGSWPASDTKYRANPFLSVVATIDPRTSVLHRFSRATNQNCSYSLERLPARPLPYCSVTQHRRTICL